METKTSFHSPQFSATEESAKASARALDSYAGGSAFTVRLINNVTARKHEVHPLALDAGPNEMAFDLAVLQFEDDGKYLDAAQVNRAVHCIRNARESKSNENGALVVVFIHGWHHGADWGRTPSTLATDPDGDTHFHEFRLILRSLALREAERYSASGAGGRRVVGVYLGWNGDPKNSWRARTRGITHTTFWNRYKVAEAIGRHTSFHDAIHGIIEATKEPVAVAGTPNSRPESPLIFIGHSMGALMLQSSIASLLEDKKRELIRQRVQTGAEPTVAIRSNDQLVSFPDLILSLNSAADSAIARRITAALGKRSIRKNAATNEIRYSPPLVISVTSTGDKDTGVTWSRAKLGRKTDGHDSSLFTHTFRLTDEFALCQRANVSMDFGQNWHCLRKPEPPACATPNISIDLPTEERNGRADVPHARYVLAPKDGDVNKAHLMWVFQVDPLLIENHNDIFNSRARSLILGLIQISGAVASVANTWEGSFEL